MPGTSLIYALALVTASGCSESRTRGELTGDGGRRTTDASTMTRDARAVDATFDAGDPRPIDAGMGTSALVCPDGRSPVGTVPPATTWPTLANDLGAPARYDCFCRRTTPSGSVLEAVTVEVQDFQEGTPVSGITMWGFYDDVVASSCGATCAFGTTDTSGLVTVRGRPGGWLATQALGQLGPTPATTRVATATYHVPIDGASTPTTWSVSAATLNLIPVVLGFRREAGTAVIMGQVTDCDDRPVQGARVQLVTEDGAVVSESTTAAGPHYRYWVDRFPDATQPHTSDDGLFIAANVPVPSSETRMRLEVWGRPSPAAPPQILAVELIRVFADAATIVHPAPLWSDVVF